MAATSDKILQLRQLLEEKFGPTELRAEEGYVTGFPALDHAGIPRGALTEVVSDPTRGPGGALLLYGLLHAVASCLMSPGPRIWLRGSMARR